MGIREASDPAETRAEVQAQSRWKKNQKLRRQNARQLTEELRKAEIIIDVQKKVAALLGNPIPEQGPGGKILMSAVTQLAVEVGTSAACQALCMPRASYYGDRRKTSSPGVATSRPSPARALRPAERETVLARLHEERFQDRSPAAVYATLLDEGEYHCSIRSMYRLLGQHGESRERRDQLTHPPYQKPELLATAPNQLWSWDITKLLGPAKWTYFYLYVILDVFSRYVTGWMVAMRESAELAKRLIEESCRKQQHPTRPAYAACRSWHFDEVQAGGLFAGRLGRQENPQPPARLGRQSLFRKPVPHPEISAGVPGPLRVHPGQPRFLAGVLSLVQRRASPLRRGLAHAGHGAPWSSRKPSCGNAKRCWIPPTNFTRSASYAALLNHPNFPAKSGSTSRLPLRRRRLWEREKRASLEAISCQQRSTLEKRSVLPRGTKTGMP